MKTKAEIMPFLSFEPALSSISNFSQRYRNTLIEIVSCLFIILYIYAGLTKLIDGHKFYDNINNSPILGGITIASIASWAIPMAELIVAFLIAWPKTRLKGMYAALGLIAIFTTYILGILFFSPYIPCSCGGVIAILSWNQHLLFNIGCTLLAILGIVLLRIKIKETNKMKTPILLIFNWNKNYREILLQQKQGTPKT
jgi:hypothetical protein